MKKTIHILGLLLFLGFTANAQVLEPVTWTFSQEKKGTNTYELKFTAQIEPGWSIYGLNIPEGGPISTGFEFADATGYNLLGEMKAPVAKVKFDPNFDMELSMYSGMVSFTREVKVTSESPVKVTGELVFMSCNDNSCLPPDYIEFGFNLPGATKAGATTGSTETDVTNESATNIATETLKDGESVLTETEIQQLETDGIATNSSETSTPTDRSFWGMFITGLLGGLLALLTPCVFPMIPLTVSFFLRNADNRARAIRDAFFYGFTIIFSYVVIGLAISVIFGADTLNALATNPWFNVFFFALLIFFAASFFGAFELTMPSSWSTALDAKADQTGGLVGVVLMGFTFVLVSFSCTGPIVGTLLVDAATGGGLFGPAIGMFGFSLALAVPFSLFAMFPAALKSLPKSGGWMNAVKVVLGFIVLAFSLKYLSTADAVAQWGILDREVFIVLWIAIFLLLGLYLIGKIKFAHDSDLKYMSVPRLMLAIASFAFVFYLMPGLWGAPLKAISSFLPSPATQDFDLSKGVSAESASTTNNTIYVGEYVKEGPHGLMAFISYEEGLAAAKAAGKPIFLDFTGLGCANCRKMEASVWSDAEVQHRLKNDFVKISLFVDDRTPLPENEQFVSSSLGRERTIKTVGQKWSVFQAERYNMNTQPYYVILDHDENPIVEPRGYNLDVPSYIDFLERGKAGF